MQLQENPCVLKILQGSGGEGVELAHSLAEAKGIFDKLLGPEFLTFDSELLFRVTCEA